MYQTHIKLKTHIKVFNLQDFRTIIQKLTVNNLSNGHLHFKEILTFLSFNIKMTKKVMLLLTWNTNKILIISDFKSSKIKMINIKTFKWNKKMQWQRE